MFRVKIYTDGGCIGNPGPGGYAYHVSGSRSHNGLVSASYLLTTNNRMELMAVIAALETLPKRYCMIDIYSDSKYVVDAIEKGWVYGWIRKGLNNRINGDLWVRLLDALEKHKYVKFIWVRGHAGDKYNELVDRAANAAARALTGGLVDEGYISAINGPTPGGNPTPKEVFDERCAELALEWDN